MPKKKNKKNTDYSDEETEEFTNLPSTSKKNVTKKSIKRNSDKSTDEAENSTCRSIVDVDCIKNAVEKKNEDTSYCKACDVVVDSYTKAIKCDGKCGLWFHLKCAKISESQFKKIQDLRGIILWICSYDLQILDSCQCNQVNKSCSQDNERPAYKNDILRSEIKILSAIEKLHTTVRTIQTNNNNKSETNLQHFTNTYANVVKSKSLNKPVIPGIIIKPKTRQSSSRTKEEIKLKINPGTINVGINSVIALSNGSVIIKTWSDLENKRFKNEAIDKLGDLYDVSRTRLRKPRLFMSGLDRKYNEDEILTELQQVNHNITPEDDIKMIFIKQNKITKKWMLSLEVSGSTYAKLVNRYINLGWRSHYLKEDTHILRCFKCQDYHHTSNSCSNAEFCVKCAGNHSIKSCTSDLVSCKNCLFSNNKYNTKLDIKHQADNTSCNIYLSKLNKMRLNTAYSTVCQ